MSNPYKLPHFEIANIDDADVAPVPMCFTPEAIATLLNTVGRLPPETGALGFGPLERMGAEVIEFDERGSAAATTTVYSPDSSWGAERQEFHLHQADERCRVLDVLAHSHPGGYGYLSSRAGERQGDLGVVEAYFGDNESPEYLFTPVLVKVGQVVVIYPWVIHRDRIDRPMVAEFRVCPASEFPTRTFNAAWLKRVETDGIREDHTSDRVTVAEIDRADEVPDSVVERDAPRTVIAGSSPSPNSYARQGGIISPALHSKAVLVAGVGGGAYQAVKLCKMGIRKIVLVDFDVVERSNLCRTAYRVEDIGKPKVFACQRLIKAANPNTQVIPIAADITEFSERELRSVTDGVDLLVGGTDQLDAQAVINRASVDHRIPAVFIGLHANADGGRVIWSMPGETGCYRCVARERFESNDDDERDLDGGHGALVDIQLVDMVALKIILAILERGQDSRYGRFYERMSEDGRNDIVVRCHPEYEWGTLLWSAVLGDLPKEPKDYAKELQEQVFFAADSLWLRGRHDPHCPICSSPCEVPKEA